MPMTAPLGTHRDLVCYCERCGKPLDRATAVMLELNCATSRYAKPGAVPEEQSQGGFWFGPDCAKAIIKAGGKNRRIGRAA